MCITLFCTRRYIATLPISFCHCVQKIFLSHLRTDYWMRCKLISCCGSVLLCFILSVRSLGQKYWMYYNIHYITYFLNKSEYLLSQTTRDVWVQGKCDMSFRFLCYSFKIFNQYIGYHFFILQLKYYSKHTLHV